MRISCASVFVVRRISIRIAPRSPLGRELPLFRNYVYEPLRARGDQRRIVNLQNLESADKG